MLQVIVFALFFGCAMVLAGSKADPIKKITSSLNEVVLLMVGMIMKIAPLGVFALMAKLLLDFVDLSLEPMARLSNISELFVGLGSYM